ncbi:hypothetical protein LTR84_007327 [Exophiala bonariae]|uniref:Uncharacterized protein n=1 Tax=Exophiala bonariae TaxID=1690606 RepID=A0AAV9N1N1_9EURO|nr:hypothetical protein LTR84_007327 [Exophiala bonariae]
MAAPGSYSAYKTNVGRSVTKKWKDANQINYDGDDWGDDDDNGYDDHPAPQPASADDFRRPAWDRQSNRSFTNPIPASYAPPPAPSQNYNRPSFDRGDEQRSFSSGPGFNSAYPSSQRDPFPEPQHDYDLPASAYRDQPPLRLNTQGPPPSNAFRPGSRGRQYLPNNDSHSPLSAPGVFSQQQRRSGSSSRPPPSEIFQRYDSPRRPDSRGSNASGRQFPPRKASLGPQSPDFTRPGIDPVATSSPAAASPPADDRPIPAFVRPSDIYKKMEEMEKVRKSQDSSRPSIDSTSVRVHPEPLDSKPMVVESQDPPVEDSDSARRLKSTLDPVPERKSEYGMDNLTIPALVQFAPPANDSPTQVTEAGVERHPTNASSVYTDRPDPVSASTISRNQSMHEGIPEEPSSISRLSYGLPAIGRMSSFGFDLGSSDPLGPSSTSHMPPTPAQPPPPPPIPIKDESTVEPPAGGLRTQPLQHQPSLGYRSMVQQAFDDSQKDTSFSPVSTTNSMFRSNSASTSDISPIISHKPHMLATVSAAQSTTPAILEEPSQTDSRRNTTETLRADPKSMPSAQQGSILSPDTYTAHSASIDPPTHSGPGPAPVATGAPTIPAGEGNNSNAPPATNSPIEKALPPVPAPPAETAPATERSTSEEWREWQAQRKQFNAQAGFQDSGPTTPHLPSPIPRTESPPKGTVRDIAEKLETNSGRSSPNNISMAPPAPGPTIAEPTRPAPQLRNESFRPALPGGWQSYASTAPSESQQATEPSIRPSPLGAHRSETTESIPTARAPVRDTNDGVTKTAFAAAATAGTALASAFMGHQEPEPKSVPKSPTRSEISSENEWDDSSSEDEGERPPAGMDQANHGRAVSPDNFKPAGPETLADRSVIAATILPSTASTSDSGRPRSDSIEYPAPLRTSRILDSSPMARPPIPNVALSTTSTNEDNDRLQHDIVNSLTPKSSNIDGDTFGASYTGPNLAQPNESTYGPTVVAQTPSNIKAAIQPNQTPQTSHSLVTVGSPVPTPPSTQAVPPMQRPHLQQRFSWETSSDKTPSTATPKQLSPAATNSPDTIREAIQPMSSLSGIAAHAGQYEGGNSQHTVDSGRPSIPGGLNQNTTPFSSGSQQAFSQNEPVSSQPPLNVNLPATTPGQIQPQSAGLQHSASQYQPGPSNQLPRSDTVQAQFYAGQSSTFQQPSHERETTPTPTTTDITPFSGINNTGNTEFAPSQLQHQYQQATSEPMSFQSILALGTPHERILAFNQSRQAYAESDGQLEGWLSSLNTSEHSDVFTLNGRVSHDTTESNSAHKPSPRRTLTESVGSRHIQEDGKKLMAKAGRFGGKAGIAAKGLFAKGKEKIRTASSGEKGRRKSTELPSTESNEVLPDPQSQPQPRDPTFLEGPPQIPFTLSPASPLESSDWFANSSLNRSKQADNTGSSIASFTQDQSSQGQEKHQGISGDTNKSSVNPTSPAISALADDDHEDEDGLPSRSVSQLTRPTADDSPVGSPQRITADRDVVREDVPPHVQQQLQATDTSAVTNLNAPGLLLGQAHGSDVHSSDRSLQVPDGRRRSIISDVSSASPSPGPDSSKQIRRSVSPADDVLQSQNAVEEEIQSQPREVRTSEDNQLPGYDQVVPEPVDLPPEKSALDDPPPRIDDPYQRAEAESNPTVSPPGTVQQPEAVHPGNEYRGSQDERLLPSDGGVAVDSARHLQEPVTEEPRKASPPPLSPVSQALSKEMSQVSVDEVFDQANAIGQRQSRSYSRPFSADPNVRNHPAFKTSEPEQPSIDRAQMYSSESPLPSARRHLEEPDRSQQQRGSQQYEATPSAREQPPSDGAYRIPGPYIQNYRSPKQITTPRIGRSETQVEASGQPLPSALRSQQQQQHQQYQQQQQPQNSGHFQQTQQIQQDSQYQQYHHQQQQYQSQPQAQYVVASQPHLDQDSGRPPFIPGQQHAQQKQQRYGGTPAEHGRQQSYGGSITSNRISQQPDQYTQRQQQPMAPPPAPSSATPVVPPLAGRKKSTFGSFFGGGSKTKLKKQERAPAPASAPAPAPVPQNQDGQQRDKRASIFRRNSRHDSISSQQSGQYHNHDQVGQLPPSNMPPHSARRQSRDLMRTSSNEGRDQPVEKKKRFSGFGNKLFKSGSTAKAPTAAHSAPQQPGIATAQPYPDQYTAQNYLSPQNSYGQYSGDAWTTQQQQPPPQVSRGFSESSQQQQIQPAYPRGPQREFSQPQRAYTYGSQQGRPESQEYSTVPANQHDNQYPTTTSPFQYTSGTPGSGPGSMHQPQSAVSPQLGNAFPYINPDQRRPSDLRIDTNTPNRSSQNVPATAPAQVYPNRGASFSPPPPGSAAPRPYGSSSPGFTTTTAPASAAAIPAVGVGRDHVIDLHKRSRSPKLGRKNSSEDFDARRRSEQQNGLAATGLGTFISKRISPVGGVPRPDSDQERPFAIGLPGLDEDADRNKTRVRTMSPVPPSTQTQHSHHHTSSDLAAGRSGTPVSLDGSATGASHAAVGTGTYSRATHAGATDGLVSRSGTSAAQHQAQQGKAIARDKSVGGAAVELPGSKPDGYESEEEVLMSATAYPGQEWMPTFVGDGRWDD